VYLATEALLLYGSPAQKEAYLPKLASGALIGTFAHAEQPGEQGANDLTCTLSKNMLHGTKIPVANGDIAHFAVVTARRGHDVVLALVDLTAGGVRRQAVRSIDASRSLASISFDGAAAEVLAGATSWDQVQRLCDRAAVLIAFEQLGGATRAFELTREYTLGRYAFGRAIASFQAVKHRLADLYVEIELARSNAYYGAWALSHDAPELAVAACGAFAAASDAFELSSSEMIQLHGGVGFTWEFDCHLFYRRAKYLAALLGGASEWREQLIQRLEAHA